MKQMIISCGRKRPADKSGYVTFRHSNGRWYQRRVADRGNEPRGGARSRHKRIAVGVIKHKDSK